MDIPGEDLPKVKHYYDEPHPYAFMKVLVVGAGNSAVDVALESFRCGSEVTMVVREPHIKESVKYWVRPDIENRIREGSINAFFNSEIVEIREKEVVIRTSEGLRTLKNDYVMAMTGYEPDLAFLDRIGIDFEGEERVPRHTMKALTKAMCPVSIWQEWSAADATPANGSSKTHGRMRRRSLMILPEGRQVIKGKDN
jgi:thioredoxin reductase (NADPH)